MESQTARFPIRHAPPIYITPHYHIRIMCKHYDIQIHQIICVCKAFGGIRAAEGEWF